jgi:Trypsin-co-occurring domain 2
MLSLREGLPVDSSQSDTAAGGRHEQIMWQRGRARLSPDHEGHKSGIPLVETVESLRTQLSEAVAAGSDEEIQFPVDGVELEFHVGVTRSAAGNGGVRFWVVELGASASYEAESIHKVKVNLGAPVDAAGRTVRIRRTMSEKP